MLVQTLPIFNWAEPRCLGNNLEKKHILGQYPSSEIGFYSSQLFGRPQNQKKPWNPKKNASKPQRKKSLF